MNVDTQKTVISANLASLIKNNGSEISNKDSMDLYYTSINLLSEKDNDYLDNLMSTVSVMTKSPRSYSRNEICQAPEECICSFLEEIGLPIIDKRTDSEILKELEEQYKLEVIDLLKTKWKNERVPSFFSYKLRYKYSTVELEDLICEKVRKDIKDELITPEVFALAMVNKNEDLNIGSTLYDAYHVVPFFMDFDRIIDNILHEADRQLFNLIESEYGYVLSGGTGEEITLHDGREWRTHYWYIRTGKIIRNAKECYEKYAGSVDTEEKVDFEEVKKEMKEKINEKKVTDLYLKELPVEIWDPKISGVTFKNPKTD